MKPCYLVPIQKWPICPISALREKFNPRNINYMPPVKFFARLDLDQIDLFLDGHYLGIDGGSVSLKFALVDENGEVISSVYLRNQGVVETVQSGLQAIARTDYEVAGVGITGSGRKFISMLVGADLIEREVLAHTIAALHFFPQVRTLIDIAGDRSRAVCLDGGHRPPVCQMQGINAGSRRRTDRAGTS